MAASDARAQSKRGESFPLRPPSLLPDGSAVNVQNAPG